MRTDGAQSYGKEIIKSGASRGERETETLRDHCGEVR